MPRFLWTTRGPTSRGKKILRNLSRKYTAPIAPSLFLARIMEDLNLSKPDVTRAGVDERLLERREKLITRIHEPHTPAGKKIRSLITFLDVDLQIMEKRMNALEKIKEECRNALVAVARAGIVKNENNHDFFQLINRRMEVARKNISDVKQTTVLVSRERRWLKIVLKHAPTRAAGIPVQEQLRVILDFFMEREQFQRRLRRMRSLS